MALTTDTARSISDNINTGDVNANIAVDTTTRVRKLSPEAAILFDKSIIARPLNAPEVCSIHVKNTEYYYRWVAAYAMEGSVYMQRKAMGFTNATADDVEILVGDAVVTNGEIRAGDLILMKLPFQKWAQHVKANMLKAKLLGDMRGVFMKSNTGDRLPSTDPLSDDRPVRASVSNEPFQRGKVETFIPSDPDSIINNSIDSGRVNKTRETMTNLREKIDSEKRG
jgi:hypothetical protein